MVSLSIADAQHRNVDDLWNAIEGTHIRGEQIPMEDTLLCSPSYLFDELDYCLKHVYHLNGDIESCLKNVFFLLKTSGYVCNAHRLIKYLAKIMISVRMRGN